MKPLMGVVCSGHTKDYALPKFIEMLDAIVYPNKVDVMFATDDYRLDIPTKYPQLVVPDMKGKVWATEIVEYGRWALNTVALQGGYTHMIWQGIDCFYAKRNDLEKLLLLSNAYDIVGGLVAGRNRSMYPVCRRYNRVGGHYTEQTTEISPRILDNGWVISISGYIGSDATIISRRAMEEVTMDGYVPWHERRDILGAFGPEEYFMWSALERHNITPRVDTSVRPWHAHETGVTVRYPGETCDLSELRF